MFSLLPVSEHRKSVFSHIVFFCFVMCWWSITFSFTIQLGWCLLSFVINMYLVGEAYLHLVTLSLFSRFKLSLDIYFKIVWLSHKGCVYPIPWWFEKVFCGYWRLKPSLKWARYFHLSHSVFWGTEWTHTHRACRVGSLGHRKRSLLGEALRNQWVLTQVCLALTLSLQWLRTRHRESKQVE